MNYHQRKQVYQNRKRKWNKKIWIAKKIGSKEDDDGYEIPIYSKPKMYMMNVQPISSSADIQEFGERAKEIQKAVIEYKKYINEFKEFDVAYLDGASPLDEGGEFVVSVKDLNDVSVRIVDELKVSNLATGEIDCYTAENANYRLYPPRNQNRCIVLYFERLTGK